MASPPESKGVPAKGRGPDRRRDYERRKFGIKPPAEEQEKRLAERRTGLERRRPHLHYDDLTQHPRPERNINDYPLSTDEVEFINAINDYKTKFNRPFPTWSEILHVLRTLGYLRADFPLPPMPAEGGPFDRAEGAEPAVEGESGAPPSSKA